MAGTRPPLMSQGQADDFYAYMSIGTGLMWLAGGLAAGPAVAALAACGLGAAVNHASSGSGRRLNYVPEQPPDRPELSQAQSETQQQYEDELQAEFGINAVYCFRTMIAEAKESGKYKSYVPLFPSFEKLRSLLRELKRRGLWKDGRLQAKPGTTPQEVFEKSNKKRDKRRRKKMEREGLFGDPEVPHSGDAGKFFAGIRASLDQTSADPIELSQPVDPDADWEESIRAEGPLYEEVEDDDTDPSLLMPPTGDPADVQMEQRLMSQIGDLTRRDIACYCYRNLRTKSGLTPQEAYEAVMRNIDNVPSQQMPTAKSFQRRHPSELCRDGEGRVLASPELQKAWDVPGLARDLMDRMSPSQLAETSTENPGAAAAMARVAIVAYILGVAPVTDKPVRRVKVWSNCRHYENGRLPMYYVIDWQWYVIGDYRDFRNLWGRTLRGRIAAYLHDEAWALFDYRVEKHISNGPPGHPNPDGWSLSAVLFGRERGFPATEEDMRGKP